MLSYLEHALVIGLPVRLAVDGLRPVAE